MAGFGAKYLAIIGGVMLMFVNFVACGAQMYQVSMKDDLQPGSVPAAATDPDSPTYGLHAPDGWKSIPIHFKVDQQLTAEQQRGLTRAMNTWQMAVGKKLFVYEGVHKGTSGDNFDDLYSSLEDEINGHYLDDHWDKTGKDVVVLATTIWDNVANNYKKIAKADIRFNSDYYIIGDAIDLMSDGEREVVDMESLALHELGHLLGLAHVDVVVDRHSIMGASLYIGEGLYNRMLSIGDIERVQKIYECQGQACDHKGLMATLEKRSLNQLEAH